MGSDDTTTTVESKYEPGDEVEWVVGKGRLHERHPRGTIREVGVEKFGYDDIIVVDCSTDPNEDTYIRPCDVTRKVA